MTKLRALLLPVLMLLLAGTCQAGGGLSPYERALPATAWVISADAFGTGCLVDREHRWVVTNYHVVKTNNRVKVVFPAYQNNALIGKRSYYHKNWKALAIRGKVIRSNSQADLALIKLDKLPRGAAALALAADSPRAGDQLYRVGSAAAAGPSWKLLTGSAKGVGRWQMSYPTGQKVLAWMVSNTVPARNGDSGAPVVNSQGQLVALHAAGNSSTSWSIEVREIRRLLVARK